MAIYNLNGGQLGAVYDMSGTRLSQAYDLRGNPLIPSGDGVDLTLMAYNVGQWYDGSHSAMPANYYPQYSQMHRKIMSDHSPDIAAFVEYLDPVVTGHSVDEMIGEYFTDSENRGNSHIAMRKAIFTRGLTIGETTLVNHAPIETIPWCYLRTSVVVNGHTVHIFIVHYYTAQDPIEIQYRKQQADEVLNIVSDLQYYIVLGDFNVICTSVNDADYTNIIKPYLDMGCYVANCTPAAGFNYTWFGGSDFVSGRKDPRDNIITSPNIIMRRAYRDMTKDAVCTQLGTRIDHVPLIAEVTVY